MFEQVTSFLCEFRDVVRVEGLHIMPRPSHNRTILDLEITASMVKEIILNLTAKQYKKGPMEDDKYPGTGDVYVFMTNIDGVKIYIKLKIDISNENKKIAKCISFHN